MQQIVHHPILADGRWCGLPRIAEIVGAVGLDQRAIGVGDLVGSRAEQVECVELDSPAIVGAISGAGIEDAGRQRGDCLMHTS